MDELGQMPQPVEKPGAQLALIRETKGLSVEEVASKLHLKVNIIKLLEADAYEQMPEPVFVKGYLRAYAKLLDVKAEPFIASFKNCGIEERKIEKALWQSKRESNFSERAMRWVTGLIVVAVIIGLGLWWQKNSDFISLPEFVQPQDAKNQTQTTQTETNLSAVSRMQSLFKTSSIAIPEKAGD